LPRFKGRFRDDMIGQISVLIPDVLIIGRNNDPLLNFGFVRWAVHR